MSTASSISELALGDRSQTVWAEFNKMHKPEHKIFHCNNPRPSNRLKSENRGSRQRVTKGLISVVIIAVRSTLYKNRIGREDLLEASARLMLKLSWCDWCYYYNTVRPLWVRLTGLWTLQRSYWYCLTIDQCQCRRHILSPEM